MIIMIIFMMGISIPGKTNFILKQDPGSFSVNPLPL